MSSRSSQEHRWNFGMLGQGSRDGRGNFSRYISKDVVGGKNSSSQKGNGANTHTERGVRSNLPVLQKIENSQAHPVASSNGYTGAYSWNSSYKHVPQLSAVNVVNNPKDGWVGPTLPLPAAFVKQPSVSASKPMSSIVPEVQVEHEKSTSSTSASLFGVYSAPHVTVAVGTMKGEVGSQRIVAESSAAIQAGCKSILVHDVANGILACDGSLALSSNPDSKSVQQLNGCSKGMVASKAIEAIAMLNEVCSLKEATSMFDVELSKSAMELKKFLHSEEATSKLSMEQPKKFNNASVIFPDHVKVPDAYKDKLVFGNIDASIVSGLAPSDGNCSAMVADDEVAADTTENKENDNCLALQQNHGSLQAHALDNLNQEEQHVNPSLSDAGSPENATSS